jgi:hypothetical protein
MISGFVLLRLLLAAASNKSKNARRGIRNIAAQWLLNITVSHYSRLGRLFPQPPQPSTPNAIERLL